MPDEFKFRAMTYNLHMFGDANDLLGIDIGNLEYHDQRRLTEFIKNVREENLLPDVIGLNEVWDEKLIEYIERELRDLYPYMIKGSINSAWLTSPDVETLATHVQGELDWLAVPSWGALEFIQGSIRWIGAQLGLSNLLGSGLLLLSRHPIISHKFVPYQAEAGFIERTAEKGVLIAIIQPTNIAATVGVMLTHAQAGDEEATRREQLRQLADIANDFRRISPRMAILAMGDLNVVGEVEEGPTSEYKNMISLLSLDDTWRRLHPTHPGLTIDLDNNPLAKHFSKDQDGDRSSRLDYILFDPTPSYYVRCAPESCQVLAYRSSEGIGSKGIKDISDHYGLLANYIVEVLPFGTITYDVGSHSSLPNIEEPATRSLLAWMEQAKIGFHRVNPAEEAPLLRIGSANPESMEGVPAIEKLGRVFLNPSPLVGDSHNAWNWGFGFDMASRQLDLGYVLQHYTGLALHSLSPNARSVSKVLNPDDADAGSVMLPFDHKRHLTWNDIPDSDHARHLSASDIEYIGKLYGRRSTPFAWKKKAEALANSEIIRGILESGLSGTKGSLDQEIVSIRRELATVQARISIRAEVYVRNLVWRARKTEIVYKWCIGGTEDEEIVFSLEGDNGLQEDKRYSATNIFPKGRSYDVSQLKDTTVHVEPNPFVVVHGITSNLHLYFKVVEDDSWFNDWGLLQAHNRSYSKTVQRPLNTEINEITSPGGPDELWVPTWRVESPGAWYADVDICLRANTEVKTELNRLSYDLNRACADQVVLSRDCRSDLAVSVQRQLERVMGGVS